MISLKQNGAKRSRSDSEANTSPSAECVRIGRAQQRMHDAARARGGLCGLVHAAAASAAAASAAAAVAEAQTGASADTNPPFVTVREPVEFEWESAPRPNRRLLFYLWDALVRPPNRS